MIGVVNLDCTGTKVVHELLWERVLPRYGEI